MKTAELKAYANSIRKSILTEVYQAQSGHPGGSLSAVDILTELYFEQMDIHGQSVNSVDRDRFDSIKKHLYFSAISV